MYYDPCQFLNDACKKIRLDSLGSIILSLSFWALLYTITRIILPHRRPEYCNRVVTSFHGAVAAYAGVNLCLNSKRWPIDYPHEITTPCQRLLILFSLGYFCMDLIWCFYYRTETKLMIAHHIFSGFTLILMLFKKYEGGVACCAVGAMEITNPLLQLRWFIRTWGYHRTRYFTIVEFLFMCSFVWVRIFLGTRYCYELIVNPKTYPSMKAITFMMNLISWAFCGQIGQLFVRRYGDVITFRTNR